ncbi:uncharacterized protein LOC119684040 [Teleopsis dalmanni]|uniref:uncharacterized protein LOC119684040 n=1 Tax=Teleopsis dalmanni TaxID=139649 RepID=UPI0018CF5D84|nr:uncharacterized protein LOC119684040 [Teleopsis dalmanni]
MYLGRVLIFALIGTVFSAKGKRSLLEPIEFSPCGSRCLRFYRCSPYFNGDPAWGIVDGVCKVFSNGCTLGNVNCSRINDCLKEVKSVEKKECQTYCPDCTNIAKDPVCGNFYYYAGAETSTMTSTFDNRCEMEKWSCWNGIPYNDATLGACS